MCPDTEDVSDNPGRAAHGQTLVDVVIRQPWILSPDTTRTSNMNSIAKHIQAVGVLLLTAFVAAAAGLYFGLPTRFNGSGGPPHDRVRQTYACLMHPKVLQRQPGCCSKCGMALTPMLADLNVSRCERHNSGCCARPDPLQGGPAVGHRPIGGSKELPAAGAINLLH